MVQGTHAPGAEPTTTGGALEATMTHPSLQIAEDHIPAMPLENFLMPADRNCTRIHPTTFKDCN